MMTQGRVQIMKLLITNFCNLPVISLEPKYSPQHIALKHPQSMLSPIKHKVITVKSGRELKCTGNRILLYTKEHGSVCMTYITHTLLYFYFVIRSTICFVHIQ
jgi:hypothetical protein